MNENPVEMKLRKTILTLRIMLVVLIVAFSVVYIVSFDLFSPREEQKKQISTKVIASAEIKKPDDSKVEDRLTKNILTEKNATKLEDDREFVVPFEIEKTDHYKILEFYEKNQAMTEDYKSFEEEYFEYLNNINMSEKDLISLFEDDQIDRIETEIEIHLEEVKESIATRTLEGHLKILLLYSFILRSQFQTNDALKNLSVADSFLPEIADYQLIRAYYIEMGENYFGLYDFRNAAEQYTKLIELNNNSYLGYFRRGCVFYYSGNYEMAIKDFQYQLKIEEIQEEINLEHYEQACIYSSEIYKLQYNTLKAIELARKSLDYNDDSVENYIYLAKLLMFIKNYDSASDYISDAELIDGENPEVILANCQLMREYEQDYEQALILVNNLLYKTPDDYVAYSERGMIYTNMGLYKAAYNDFNRAIEIEPMYANAYGNRGWIYFKYMKQRDRALADYNNAVLLDTNLDYVYNNRGVLLMESFRDNAKAIEDFNHALRINDRYYLAFVNRGIAKHRMNEFKGAIDDFTKAKAIENENYIAFYQLGKAYYDIGEFEKSVENFTEALDRNDEIWEPYLGRAKSYIKLRRFDKAKTDLKEALQINSSLEENEDYQKLLIDCQENKS